MDFSVLVERIRDGYRIIMGASVMGKNKKLTEDQKREQERMVDDAMSTARRMFFRLESECNPYAMLLAVESIPKDILRRIIERGFA